jgi:hypothetical protein
MSDSYLDIAENILRSRGRPLTAQEILENAIRYGLTLPNRGRTMHKTLQARITEDLLQKRHRSRFVRVSRGLYSLRSLLDAQERPTTITLVGSHRVRSLPQDRILSIPRAIADVIFRAKAFAPLHKLYEIDLEYAYIGTNGLLPVALFIMVRCGERLLVHTVGSYSFYRSLIGAPSPGLRSYVDEFDHDLFSTESYGLPHSAAREIGRVLQLPYSILASIQLPETRILNFLPIHLDIDQERIIIPALIDIPCTNDRPKPRRRLDIKDPHWVPQLYYEEIFKNTQYSKIVEDALR